MAEDVITTSIDLRRMVQEAQAAGFNPLTVMRNGLGAGFATQRTQYGEVGGGSFTAAPVAAPAAAPEPASHEATYGASWSRIPIGTVSGNGRQWWDGTGWASEGVNVDDAAPGLWELDSEFNIAVHQLRERSGAVITDDGRYVPTRSPASAGGGMFNPRPDTHPGGEALPSAPSVRAGLGFQSDQVYQTDKLPNVVSGDTAHYVLPGVAWIELGGSTRGEVWETIYGEVGGNVMSVPKLLNDAGYNLLQRPAEAGLSLAHGWLSSGFGGVFAPGWGGIAGAGGGNMPPLRIVVDGANPIK